MGDKTPTKEVLEMQDWNPVGNIIPHTWFSLIRTEGKRRNQPDYLTIHILADICYWYRPTIVLNEETGEFQGYERKFKGEYLQKHTTHLAKQYGTDDRTARRSLQKLEEMGIIERIFKNEEVNGRVFNDIQYIRLVPNKIKELSKSDPGGRICKTGGVELQGRGVGLIRPHTENTTKTTNKEKDIPSVNTSGNLLLDKKIKEKEERISPDVAPQQPDLPTKSQTRPSSGSKIALTDEEKLLLGETDNVQPRQRKDEKGNLSLGGRRSSSPTKRKEGRTAAQVMGNQKENEISCLDDLMTKYNRNADPLPNIAASFWRDAYILAGFKWGLELNIAEKKMISTFFQSLPSWKEDVWTLLSNWTSFQNFCVKAKWKGYNAPAVPTMTFLAKQEGKELVGQFLNQQNEFKQEDDDIYQGLNIEMNPTSSKKVDDDEAYRRFELNIETNPS